MRVLLLFLNTNFASKREQCQTCLSIAEREQSQDRDSGINPTNYNGKLTEP